jgi:hypothetical protein
MMQLQQGQLFGTMAEFKQALNEGHIMNKSSKWGHIKYLPFIYLFVRSAWSTLPPG